MPKEVVVPDVKGVFPVAVDAVPPFTATLVVAPVELTVPVPIATVLGVYEFTGVFANHTTSLFNRPIQFATPAAFPAPKARAPVCPAINVLLKPSGLVLLNTINSVSVAGFAGYPVE